MPGGREKDFAMGKGYTAVHEVGHWIGLYHVFEGYSCVDDGHPGDAVDDTPVQSQENHDCREEYNSCPDKQGKDSMSLAIHSP